MNASKVIDKVSFHNDKFNTSTYEVIPMLNDTGDLRDEAFLRKTSTDFKKNSGFEACTGLLTKDGLLVFAINERALYQDSKFLKLRGEILRFNVYFLNESDSPWKAICHYYYFYKMTKTLWLYKMQRVQSFHY